MYVITYFDLKSMNFSTLSTKVQVSKTFFFTRKFLRLEEDDEENLE